MGAPSSNFEASSQSLAGRTPLQSSTTSINNDATVAPTKADLEATYTSLIQQYLQVMCLENATFLSERMVATCKSTNALYLLAVCHYRSGSPQRAQSVLEDAKSPTPATQYLLAKCCYDMEQYGRAEEALLQKARADYREFKAASEQTAPAMDEWIVETAPCPVPNGAAGFYLLANICRKSSRKQRAAEYYRMSLKVKLQQKIFALVLLFFINIILTRLLTCYSFFTFKPARSSHVGKLRGAM
jgi:tetratricopeptide (TPR) repeat protein